MYYVIEEKWKVMEYYEYYNNTRKNLAEVKKYIKDWLSSWKENAEESGGKYIREKTDYKTFARCAIRLEKEVSGIGYSSYDTFNLKVIKKKGKEKTYNALFCM